MSEILSEPTDEILEAIGDASWNWDNKPGLNGVNIHERHTINACNHVYSGTVERDGISYGFQIEMGDIRGCEVHDWGLADDVGTFDPGPPPEPRTFIPADPLLFVKRPQMFDVYCYWRSQSWFVEKAQSYNYDRHFQPGGYVENHYREWAASKGLKVGYLSELSQNEQARIKELIK